MAKKNKYKKLQAGFLFEISLPEELWKAISYDDKKRLETLNRLDMRWKTPNNKYAFVFHLGDIFKVRELLRKYNYTVSYPESKELKRFGLSYSGESLNISRSGDNFIIKQEFPDGRVETHIIPEKRVWRVYYTIKRYFERNPDSKKVVSSVIWEAICREFGIGRYFDKYGNFHANSFFGDRRTYFDFAYFPMKVLAHIGKIEYRGKYIYNMLIEQEEEDMEEEQEREDD